MNYELEVYPYRKFSALEVNDIIKKKKYIYVYGLFTYSDVFDDKHIIKFCYRLMDINFNGLRLNNNYNSAN